MVGTPVNVIDFFFHPPLGLMKLSTTTPTALTNPYSGTFDLTVHSGLASAYGILFSTNSAPAGAGLAQRAALDYEMEWFQFLMQYTLFDGTTVSPDKVGWTTDVGFFLWEIALPSTLHCWVAPGFTANISWIIGV